MGEATFVVECIEATDFARQVLKGNTRWVSLLRAHYESVLLETAAWKRLQVVQHQIPLHRFVNASVHQANGLIRQGKKQRGKISDKMKLTYALHLLQMSQAVIQERTPHLLTYEYDDSILDELVVQSVKSVSAIAVASKLYEHVERYMDVSKQFKKEEMCTDGLQILEDWLAFLDGETNEEKKVDTNSCMQVVSDVLPVLEASTLASRNAVHVAQCGSAMYGLATSTSDVDYHVVYMKPSSELLALGATSDKTIQHSVDAAYGSDKAGIVEYVAKELGQYVGALVKSHPNAIELLFLPPEKNMASSWIWKELVDMRRMFITKQCVSMYFGFVRSHLSKARLFAESHGVDDTRALSKALYHTFHKLFELKRLLHGVDLHVTLKGSEREFVYGIRTQPLEGEQNPTRLLELAQSLLDEMAMTRESQTENLEEMVDSTAVAEWLHSVRVRSMAYE